MVQIDNPEVVAVLAESRRILNISYRRMLEARDGEFKRRVAKGERITPLVEIENLRSRIDKLIGEEHAGG